MIDTAQRSGGKPDLFSVMGPSGSEAATEKQAVFLLPRLFLVFNYRYNDMHPINLNFPGIVSRIKKTLFLIPSFLITLQKSTTPIRHSHKVTLVRENVYSFLKINLLY